MAGVLLEEVDGHSVDGVLISSKLDGAILVVVNLEHCVSHWFIVRLSSLLVLSARSNDEHLQQQVQVVFHVVVPKHVVEVPHPSHVLVEWQHKLIQSTLAHLVLAVLSRSVQILNRWLVDLHLAIKTYLYPAAFWSYKLALSLNTGGNPVAVFVVVLLYDVHTFI